VTRTGQIVSIAHCGKHGRYFIE